MSFIPNRIACVLAKKRTIQSLLGRVLPATGVIRVAPSLNLWIDLKDRTGPSFHVNHSRNGFFTYEKHEKAEIEASLPQDGTFIDAGANIGIFAFFVASRFPGAKIIAFEPHPMLLQCMQRTIASNSFSNIDAVGMALGDVIGQTDLYLHDNNSGGHSTVAGEIDSSEIEGKVPIPVTTLDHYVEAKGLRNIDVLKVDVQGAEWQFLRGAAKTIARFQPKMLIEFSNRELLSAEGKNRLTDYFKNLDYVVRRAGQQLVVPLAKIDQIAADEIPQGRLNTTYALFLPK